MLRTDLIKIWFGANYSSNIFVCVANKVGKTTVMT